MRILFENDRINYIFRTYLPRWNFEKRLEETIQFCRETDIKHIMLFTDAQTMVWNQLSLEELNCEAKNLTLAITRLHSKNIIVGINTTYNMSPSRADHCSHCDYDHWATYADGSCDYRLPCLLDPKLEKYMVTFYSTLAKANPDFIYIDDDHRYMLTGIKETTGCFCNLHLQKFGELTGRKWTVGSLQNALFNDQEIRGKWFDFLGSRLIELSNLMRNSISAVNPNIEVGMMIPCIHALPLSGNKVTNILAALSKSEKPLVRPCIGPYSDKNRREIIPGLFYMELTRHMLGDNATYTPEIETFPFTRVSKAAATVRFHIVQGILNGMNNPALSISSYAGDSPFFETEYIKMIKDSRQFFESIREQAPANGSRKGIQLIWDLDAPKHFSSRTKSVSDWYLPCFVMHDILGTCGLPVTYDESPIKFLVGDTVKLLSEEKIKDILGSGVILDASAANILITRGFGNDIGCISSSIVEGWGGEYCNDENFFGKYKDTCIPLFAVTLESVYDFKKLDAANEISYVMNHDLHRLSSGVILFENINGGKIAILPYKITATDGDLQHLVCYQRQKMFREILNMMNPTVIPVLVNSPSDFAIQYWQDKRSMTIVLTNLSYDVANSIELVIKSNDIKLENASYIDENGNLIPLTNCTKRVNDLWYIAGTFPIFNPLIIKVTI